MVIFVMIDVMSMGEQTRRVNGVVIASGKIPVALVVFACKPCVLIAPIVERALSELARFSNFAIPVCY